MATKRQTKVNAWYIRAAIEQLVLAIDDHSMFCKVISERVSGVSYRVEVDEETMLSKSCSCPARTSSCKHRLVVDQAFANYKPVPPTPVEPKITEVEAGSWYVVNSDSQVWKTEDGQWLAVGTTENAVEIVKAHIESQVEQEQAVAEAERIVDVVVLEAKAQAEVDEVMDREEKAVAQQFATKRAPKWQVHLVDEDKVVAPKPEDDISTKGTLNGNRGFSILKIA